MRDLFVEGGFVFMGIITLLFIVIVALAISTLKVQSPKNEAKIRLIKSVALFTLVFGILSQLMGLVQIFDYLSTATIDVSASVLAGGIKTTFIPAIYGLCIYLFALLLTLGLGHKTKSLA
jgi:hypothetical protein